MIVKRADHNGDLSETGYAYDLTVSNLHFASNFCWFWSFAVCFLKWYRLILIDLLPFLTSILGSYGT